MKSDHEAKLERDGIEHRPVRKEKEKNTLRSSAEKKMILFC